MRFITGISFPANTDATKTGYNMITYAMGETLTRLTPENKLAFWLAESITNVNPTTWRVKLRPNIKFWDNTAADATAVAAVIPHELGDAGGGERADRQGDDDRGRGSDDARLHPAAPGGQLPLCSLGAVFHRPQGYRQDDDRRPIARRSSRPTPR